MREVVRIWFVVDLTLCYLFEFNTAINRRLMTSSNGRYLHVFDLNQ